jgi:Flp pilus assembly protein TadD
MLDALGWAQYKNGQHAQAAISVGEALRKAPHEPLILSHAAIIAYALGKKEQARWGKKRLFRTFGAAYGEGRSEKDG